MPIGVNTELYSGLPQLRGIKTPEPEDVADAIVEALQTGRYEVYVPKRMKGTLKLGTLLPLRARDWINRATGGDQMMTQPDHGARAAYEARMRVTIEGPPPAPAAAAPPVAADAAAPAPEAPAPEAPAPEASGARGPCRQRRRRRCRRAREGSRLRGRPQPVRDQPPDLRA